MTVVTSNKKRYLGVLLLFAIFILAKHVPHVPDFIALPVMLFGYVLWQRVEEREPKRMAILTGMSVAYGVLLYVWH